jgi:hypothetical protein
MHPHSVFIGASIVLSAVFFGVIAWTGRVKFGSWTLLDRRTQPLAFWAVYFGFLALIVSDMRHLPEMLDRVAAMNAELKKRSTSP